MQQQKNANLEPPLIPCPRENDPVGIVWSPYPSVGQVPMSAPRCVGTELAKLAEITVGVPGQFAPQRPGMGFDQLWDATNKVHARLLKWKENLSGVQSHLVPQTVYLQ